MMRVITRKVTASATVCTVTPASGQLAASGLMARYNCVTGSRKNRVITIPNTQLTSEAACLMSPLRQPTTSEPSKMSSKQVSKIVILVVFNSRCKVTTYY